MALSLSNSLNQVAARCIKAVPGSRRSRRTSITALDIEDGWLQAIQATTHGGRVRIVRHAAGPLALKDGAPATDPAALGEAVARKLEELGIKPGPVVMGVPRAQAMLRRLDLPPAKKQSEVASMVYFKVSRDLPFRLEEALLDFQILPELDGVTIPPEAQNPAPAGENSSPPSATPARVLAAVVRQETVKHFQALAEAADIKLVALGLRCVASIQAVEACEGKKTEDCIALVSTRKKEVIFDVLCNGDLAFSRVGTLSNSLENGRNPTAIETVVTEVVRSLHSYESEKGQRHVGRFLVVGATGAEAAIAAALGQRFGVPALMLNPAAALSEAEGDKVQTAGAMPAIGLALGVLEPGGLPFDFLNPKRPPVQRDYGRVRLLGAVAGALALLLSVAGLRAHWIHQREEQLAGVRQQAELAAKNLNAYRTVRSEALALKAWDSGKRNWLDQLAALSTLLPESRDLYVTALSASANNTLTLGVRARSSEIVDRTSNALRAAGYQVRPPAITPVSDRNGYRIQASLELTVPATVTNLLKHS